jgi:hypothetical protein
MTEHVKSAQAVLTVLQPSFIAMAICFSGLFISMKERKKRVAARARWRERYRVSPEANLLRLND